MRKNLYFHSFHVKAEFPIALKVKVNIQFFALFLMLYSMLRHVRLCLNIMASAVTCYISLEKA